MSDRNAPPAPRHAASPSLQSRQIESIKQLWAPVSIQPEGDPDPVGGRRWPEPRHDQHPTSAGVSRCVVQSSRPACQRHESNERRCRPRQNAQKCASREEREKRQDREYRHQQIPASTPLRRVRWSPELSRASHCATLPAQPTPRAADRQEWVTSSAGALERRRLGVP